MSPVGGNGGCLLWRCVLWIYPLWVVLIVGVALLGRWLLAHVGDDAPRAGALSLAFQYSGWACCIDPTVGLRQLPPDPTVVRIALTTWQQGAERGAVLVREEARDRRAPVRPVLYLWVSDPTADGFATYVANMGRLEYGHGGRDTAAAAIVRSLTEELPGLRAAWAVQHVVGVALDADVVGAPFAWAEWLPRVGAALAAGRSPIAPPGPRPAEEL